MWLGVASRKKLRNKLQKKLEMRNGTGRRVDLVIGDLTAYEFAEKGFSGTNRLLFFIVVL